jgi:enoyl-CoA hydratase/carnithine racemase
MSEHVVTECADGVFTLRFNRPDKKNALTSAMYAAAADAFVKASADASVRVIVITGSGDSFTAGNDLKDFLDNPPTSNDAPVFRFMHAVVDCEKPILAAVNGVAVGIGTTLLLHCDFVIATPAARFQLPFVNLALVPEFASSLLLPRVIGPRRAMEVMFLGGPFMPDFAMSCGLINALVPADQLDVTVKGGAGALASKPPAALRATKALLRGDVAEIKQRIAVEAAIFSERLKSGEFREAAEAFLAKRVPDFSKFN